ncbi:phage tail protein [Citrobacter freundii]|uniref:phage tail protein n=1 Tax=Citrobacter freundii TaxID=546 RepID=UPI0010A38AD3|nr:phage tail protein [Citrobacter freundii]EKS9219633.1 phage tail protein [Citrobacter freundii]NTX94375.1 phage tail protein [Citrobacter freundii]THE47075.1 phage tail protein [Citrobacter freundii]HAT7537150.1 phage tail protein [Citrobacter freundii]
MTNRLSTEILINLAGNLTAKARQYGANMSEFASRNQKAMSVVKAASESAGRGLDMLGSRYTAMIAGIGSSLTVKQVADFDAQMRRMGTDAQLSVKEVDELRTQIRDVSNMADIRIESSVLGQGVGELLGKTGDYEFTKKNLRNMGLLMQAFGVDGQTAAGLLAQFWEKGIRGADEVSKTLDNLYAQFAVGSVSVADVAKVAPKLFSTIADQGPVAIAQMGAFLQIFAKNKGSAEETTTSIQAMYAALSNKKNIDFLRSNGIDVFKKGTKELKLPFELMQEIIKRAKRDPIKLQDVFDQTGMQGITALLRPENIRMMEEMIYGTVELGSTQKAAQRNAEGFNSAMQSLNNEWQRFAENELAEPIQNLADALNSVDKETAQNWLNVGKQIAIVTAGVIAARKAFQIGKGAWDFLKPEKGGKGIPKGVSDVFGSGVMPVYVVNMGKGGMGGPGDLIPDGPDGKNPRKPNGPRRLGSPQGMVGLTMLASTIPYLYEEPSLSSDDKAGMVQWAKDRAKRKANEKPVIDPRPWASLTPATPFIPALNNHQAETPRPETNDHSLFGVIVDFLRGTNAAIENKNAFDKSVQPPALPTPLQKMQGEIRVILEGGGGRVKSVSMNQPGIKLSASAGVSSVEQG